MRLEKWFISNLDDSQRNIIVQNIDKSIAVVVVRLTLPSIALFKRKIRGRMQL